MISIEERKQIYNECIEFLEYCKKANKAYQDIIEYKEGRCIRLDGLCRILRTLLFCYNIDIDYGIHVLDRMPEIMEQKPENLHVLIYWWNTSPYDYDSRIQALEKAIELCDKG